MDDRPGPTRPATPRVAIVGAGLAGLTAALRCQAFAQVALLEASSRTGGQIWTDTEAGLIVERGGEGFVARSQAVPALARDVGLAEELIGQSVLRSYGYDGRELRVLAPGEAATFLGFQVPQEDLGKGIRSLRRGMGSLVGAIEQALTERVGLRLNVTVDRIELEARGGVRVVTTTDALEVDAVVIAAPAAACARMLAGAIAEPARALTRAATVSSVTVELAYEHAGIDHPLDATGFVVALDAQRDGLRACTFTSSKFAGRAPADQALFRLFFRPSDADLEQLDDAVWTARARAGLERVLSLHGGPTRAWVSRWPSALPVFDDAFRSDVAALEQALEPHPVVLAGSAFHGSGIDAAVRSGERAAERLRERFGVVPG
jgi:oxygen-dependent protoporphyrinogen oxidase